MTAINPSAANPVEGWGHRSPPWQPAYTEKEARLRGVSKATFRTITPWARGVAHFHHQHGTPRADWEPTNTQVDELLGPIIDDGEAALEDALAAKADPLIDEAQEALEEAQRTLDDAMQRPRPIRTPESRTTYSGADAVDMIEDSSNDIEADFAAGKHHHVRTRQGWLLASKLVPLAECLGLLVFCAFFLNVPVLTPWTDWPAWTLAFSIVVLLTTGQMVLVHYAAKNHNQARDARAANNRHEAEAACTRRNWFLLLAGTITLVIVGGMVERGLASLGDSDQLVYVIMLSLAALAGLAMPVLAFLPQALDGSKKSREVDAVSDDLDVDLEQQDEDKAVVRANVDRIVNLKDRLNGDALPSSCNYVQSVVDEAHGVLAFGRAQIGGLAADPPGKQSRRLEVRDGNVVGGEITTGIPGARSVSLLPLLDRNHRMREIHRQAEDLRTRLADLPKHPWSKSSRRNRRSESVRD
jgi:hypothetical protein